MPSGTPINLIGQRFDKLEVVALAPKTGHGRRWVCRCDCGGLIEKLTGQLRRNQTRIGCKACEKLSRSQASALRTHGYTAMQRPRLYDVWRGMKRRCSDVKHPSFKNYGGRGIAVCAEWLDFGVFKEWAMGHGYADNLTIERIDPNCGYAPENCEFITKSENSRRVHALRRAAKGGL